MERPSRSFISEEEAGKAGRCVHRNGVLGPGHGQTHDTRRLDDVHQFLV